MQARTSIYAVRTTIGQEKGVTDLITTAVVGETDVYACPWCAEEFPSEKDTKTHMKKCKKAKKSGEPKLISTNQLLGRVKAILVPETLRGYVFLETLEFRDVEIAISGVPHVRGRVGGKVSFEEIDKFLVPPPAAEGLGTGDVVELTSGPFKGERARITRVDTAKEELIVELLDSPHTIPLRTHADFVKIVEKAKREEVAEEVGEDDDVDLDDSLDDDEFDDDDSFWAHD